MVLQTALGKKENLGQIYLGFLYWARKDMKRGMAKPEKFVLQHLVGIMINKARRGYGRTSGINLKSFSTQDRVKLPYILR